MASKLTITPFNGSTTAGQDPNIKFQGTGNSTDITLRVAADGSLSFEGTAGQLFSITNSLTGTIFSVNDISGIPSIEVLDSGLVKLCQYNGSVSVGKTMSVTGILSSIGVYNNTTGASANMVSFSDGTMGRSTSTLAAKNLLDDLTLAEAKNIVLNNRALRFTMKNGNSTEYIGYGAELIAEKDRRLVSYDLSGQPDGVHYATFVVPQGKVLDDHEDRLAELEAAFEAYKASHP